jgi:hypothetical protein
LKSFSKFGFCSDFIQRNSAQTTRVVANNKTPLDNNQITKMSDNKLRCALVYRLEGGSSGGGDSPGDGIALSNLNGNCTLLAKYDHASDYESSGGSSALYGDREKNYADAVGMVVGNDPPAGVAEEGVIGGFKVVQSDMHQVVYGADSEGLCEFFIIINWIVVRRIAC